MYACMHVCMAICTQSTSANHLKVGPDTPMSIAVKHNFTKCIRILDAETKESSQGQSQSSVVKSTVKYMKKAIKWARSLLSRLQSRRDRNHNSLNPH